MRLTLAYPDHGTQICIDVEDPVALNSLYDHRLGQDIDGSILGQQFAGYLFRLGGGFDKQGFPMKQGVLTPRRVRLLLRAGTSCYRPRKDGERKRKTVRGCVISSEISALHLIVLKKGDAEIEGLTDKVVPRRYGPKRATRIRAIFGADKKADVTKLVLRREVKPGKFTQPKIQRLITPRRLARKAKFLKEKKARKEAAVKKAEAYKALLEQRGLKH
ncbi:40S ribosomal protein S6 [Histomonas meleagridis]|uniref:40S ribosomal protein S6 n=1 Tax=Histomonas meleagridis TaxID=135588 RepID=UPI00355A804C|nr:40S ribosomal protein S6 [Histomonas meleagridis]KAH0804865.1 40S ribosomal protein S6 [Histomonas meleagridis]